MKTNNIVIRPTRYSGNLFNEPKSPIGPVVFVLIAVLSAVAVHFAIPYSKAILRLFQHEKTTSAQVSSTVTTSYNKFFVPDAIGPDIYAGDSFGSRFYTQTDITPGNVSQLKISWEQSTGDANTAKVDESKEIGPGFESSPIIVDGRLIEITPTEQLVALDPANGRILWRFTPPDYTGFFQVNRGPACWSNCSGLV